LKSTFRTNERQRFVDGKEKNKSHNRKQPLKIQSVRSDSVSSPVIAKGKRSVPSSDVGVDDVHHFEHVQPNPCPVTVFRHQLLLNPIELQSISTSPQDVKRKQVAGKAKREWPFYLLLLFRKYHLSIHFRTS